MKHGTSLAAALIATSVLLPGQPRAEDFCLAGARYSYAIAMQHG
jgi:hypothetical protein